MTATLTNDEVRAALAKAHQLGLRRSAEELRSGGRLLFIDDPVPELAMMEILQAAYEHPSSRPTRVRALREEHEGLELAIARRKRQLARLERARDQLAAEIEALREEKADVLAPERLVAQVRRLLIELRGAEWSDAFTLQAEQWERAERAFIELMTMTEEGA